MSGPLVDRLLAITTLFEQDMARAFAGTPLTPARVAVLWTLAHHGPCTQQALSTALSVTPRNISGLVDALALHGYVERRPHPDDRRAVLVEMTEQAVALTATMRLEHAQLESELLAAVAPEDREGLDRGIDAVLARLTDLTASPDQDAGRQ